MARKSSSTPKKTPKTVQQAIAAIEAGQFGSPVFEDPDVIAKLSKDQQLSVWRAKRIEWLGDKGWKSVDDLYRKERLSAELPGYQIVSSNVLKKFKGTPSKNAKKEADAHSGEVRWHSGWNCPCVAFKFPEAFANTPFSRWAVKAYGKKPKKGTRAKKEESAEIRAMKELVAGLSIPAQEVLWEAYQLCGLEREESPIEVEDFQNIYSRQTLQLIAMEDWYQHIADESGLNKALWVSYGEDELIKKGLMDQWEEPVEVKDKYYIDFSELDRLTELGFEVAEYLAD